MSALKCAKLADDNAKLLVSGFIRHQNELQSEQKIPEVINYIVLYYYFFWNVKLCVKGQDGTEIYFKVKITTKMQKLMDAYCARIGVDNNSRLSPLRFSFDGTPITGADTAQSLSMKDEDDIDVMVPGIGGYG